MALGAILVDKARVLRNDPQASKVDGRTQHQPVALPWFRARLTIAARTRSGEGNRSRVASSPTLTYEFAYPDGTPILLSSEDTVEVESAQFGNAVYRLSGEPQPSRKRRSILAWRAPLKRVEQKEAQQRPVRP